MCTALRVLTESIGDWTMTPKIERALKVAFEQHGGQQRKCSRAPYVVHPLEVACRLMAEPEAGEDVIVAGILHDTLEDTPYTADQLEAGFGPAVRRLVEFATEPGEGERALPSERRATWKTRKQHTITACRTAGREQLLVVLADKVSNLQSLHDDFIHHGDELWDHFHADRGDIAWYYHELGGIFRQRLAGARMIGIYQRLMDLVFPDHPTT